MLKGYIEKLIINKEKNKSSCNKKYYQKIPHIELKMTLKRTSLYRVNNSSVWAKCE